MVDLPAVICQRVPGDLDVDQKIRASLVAQMVKTACNAGGLGSVPGSERSLEEGNGNPLQYSCLENSMDGGSW